MIKANDTRRQWEIKTADEMRNKETKRETKKKKDKSKEDKMRNLEPRWDETQRDKIKNK